MIICFSWRLLRDARAVFLDYPRAEVGGAWYLTIDGALNGTTQNERVTVISEVGMYKLAFCCQSSECADKFTNWVVGEVLPSIRKTGRYELKPQKRSSMRRTRGDGVNVELTNLLWLIGESLEQGDQSAIALMLRA